MSGFLGLACVNNALAHDSKTRMPDYTYKDAWQNPANPASTA
jgi:hypothetical protein